MLTISFILRSSFSVLCISSEWLETIFLFSCSWVSRSLLICGPEWLKSAKVCRNIQILSTSVLQFQSGLWSSSVCLKMLTNSFILWSSLSVLWISSEWIEMIFVFSCSWLSRRSLICRSSGMKKIRYNFNLISRSHWNMFYSLDQDFGGCAYKIKTLTVCFTFWRSSSILRISSELIFVFLSLWPSLSLLICRTPWRKQNLLKIQQDIHA